MTDAELLAIIAQAKREKATVLDLSNKGIKTVPSEISQLTYLKRLFLSNNEITKFPEAITKIFSLEDLSLSNNQISEVPDTICQLANLKELSLWGNKISKISNAIAQLESLEEIDLSRNHIVVIPISVTKISSLKILHLENNQIREIPSEIGQLKNLSHLFLYSNEIREIPSSISQMTDLKTLSLYCNQIREIPEAVCQIPKLEDLTLFSNHLRKLPKSISQLKKTLKKLWLSLNQINEIPDEIGKLSNLQVLDLSNNQIVEIPVTINQLLKLQELDLRNNLVPIPPDILEDYKNPSAILKYWQVLGIIDNAVQNRLNIVDLSGKGIQVIPPVIAELSEVQNLNLSGNQISSISDSLTQIFNLQMLDLSGNQISSIPDSIINLSKLRLLDLSGNQIVDVPESICQLSNLQSLDLRDNLLTVPAKILDNYKNPKVIFHYLQNLQSVKQKPLNEAKIVFIRYEAAVKTPLLELMKKFELCFPLELSNPYPIYLIPELLPEEEPDTGIWNDTLKFEYHFTFLPSSIISRFIVKMQHYVSKQTYWRAGVVLCSREGNRAHIKANLTDSKIFISIDGNVATRLIFLGAIRSAFDSIYYSYEKSLLGVDERIPLPDKPHITIQYALLLKHQKIGRTKYFHEDSECDYNIPELLSGISSIEDSRSEKEENRGNTYIFHKEVGQVVGGSTTTQDKNIGIQNNNLLQNQTLESSQPDQAKDESKPMKTILMLAANPQNSVSLQLQQEERDIKERLRLAGYGTEPIKTAVAVHHRDITQAMLDFKPQIIHFSGHGANEDGLVFEDIDGQFKLIGGEGLADLFDLFSDHIECVVLNACYSETQAEAIRQKIQYVIGMNQAIGDRAAIEFAVGFYAAIGAGETYEFAFKLGCNAIRLAGIKEYTTPQLLQKV